MAAEEDPNLQEDIVSGDLKIIVVGNQSTGKTSLINRYIHQEFQERYKATLGANFEYKVINVSDVNFKVSFWDLAGQDRSPQVANLFARDSNGVIFLCEYGNKVSKEDTLKWKESVLMTNSEADLSMILIENKSDLVEGGDLVGVEEIETFAIEHGFIKGFRTSAKTGFNVNEAIDFLLQKIVDRGMLMSSFREPVAKNEEEEIDLQKSIQASQKAKKQSCC